MAMFTEENEFVDSPEFIARCQTCKMRECNCEGGESLQTCIKRNGVNFEFSSYTVQHRYRRGTKSLEFKSKPLQTLKTGTDWHKRAEERI